MPGCNRSDGPDRAPRGANTPGPGAGDTPTERETMDQTLTTHVHPRRRRRIAALLALALVSGSLGAGALSLAVFTDSEAVTGNAFATGSIDLATDKTEALFNVPAMIPGDVVIEQLIVSNEGARSLRYAMTTTVDSGTDLATALELTIKKESTSCAAFDGDVVMTTKTLATSAFGSSAQGAQAGDRTLAGGAYEVLCFRAELPIGAAPSLASSSAVVTFTFDAEQTDNNP